MCSKYENEKFDLDEIKKDTSRIKDSSSKKAPNPGIKILRILVQSLKRSFLVLFSLFDLRLSVKTRRI